MGYRLLGASFLFIVLANSYRSFVDTAPLEISNGDPTWEINTNNRKTTVFDDKIEQKWNGPFYFVQGADPQFGLISRYIEHQTNITWEKEKTLSEAIVERINKMDPPPRFFVICGDLIDAVPNALRTAQEKDFALIFRKVKKEIPVLCVCGNHDVGDKPTKQSVARYQSTFGDDYYSFYCGGVLFMVINSQFFFNDTEVKDLSAEQEKWIMNELQSAKKAGVTRSVVFQHIPWFLKTVDEPDDEYFNIARPIREKWLAIFKAAGVVGIFCGHYHRNAGGSYEGMPVITTTAIGGQLGDDVSGARVVKVLENSIDQTYFPTDKLPLKVDYNL